MPVWRQFLPKADGKQQPLGVTSLGDKIVQRAVVMVFGAIYGEDFNSRMDELQPYRSVVA